MSTGYRTRQWIDGLRLSRFSSPSTDGLTVLIVVGILLVEAAFLAALQYVLFF